MTNVFLGLPTRSDNKPTGCDLDFPTCATWRLTPIQFRPLQLRIQIGPLVPLPCWQFPCWLLCSVRVLVAYLKGVIGWCGAAWVGAVAVSVSQLLGLLCASRERRGFFYLVVVAFRRVVAGWLLSGSNAVVVFAGCWLLRFGWLLSVSPGGSRSFAASLLFGLCLALPACCWVAFSFLCGCCLGAALVLSLRLNLVAPSLCFVVACVPLGWRSDVF